MTAKLHTDAVTAMRDAYAHLQHAQRHFGELARRGVHTTAQRCLTLDRLLAELDAVGRAAAADRDSAVCTSCGEPKRLRPTASGERWLCPHGCLELTTEEI